MQALAFDLVMARHAGAVRGFLGRRLRDPALADEATQETFVRAYVRRDTLRDPARMGSWLLGIARRVSAELQRRRPMIPLHDVPEEALGAGRDVESAYLERESFTHLARAVASLGEARRAALLMRVDDELGYDDIATRLGWTLAKVKNEIHRARRELARAMAATAALLLLVMTVPQLAVIEPVVANDAMACFESDIALTETAHQACLIATPVPDGIEFCF